MKKALAVVFVAFLAAALGACASTFRAIGGPEPALEQAAPDIEAILTQHAKDHPEAAAADAKALAVFKSAVASKSSEAIAAAVADALRIVAAAQPGTPWGAIAGIAGTILAGYAAKKAHGAAADAGDAKDTAGAVAVAVNQSCFACP